jgi:hypothetical protein
LERVQRKCLFLQINGFRCFTFGFGCGVFGAIEGVLGKLFIKENRLTWQNQSKTMNY